MNVDLNIFYITSILQLVAIIGKNASEKTQPDISIKFLVSGGFSSGCRHVGGYWPIHQLLVIISAFTNQLSVDI